MRIALFDPVAGGHHSLYARRFAEALRPLADVVLAMPDETIVQLEDLAVETIPLGTSRIGTAGRFSRARRRLVAAEAERLQSVVERSRADHVVHLYADTVLPRLLRRPRMSAGVSVLLFYPWSHYPKAFDSPLSARERVRASARELLTAAWRRRPDAHSLLTLDEEAARRWSRSGGAPAYWIPEPPVSAGARPGEGDRAGCILYGALADRKGVDLLAAAVAFEPMPVPITIAGEAHDAFVPRLAEYVEEMRRAGACVEVRASRHTEVQGLQALAAARCAVLPYTRHTGMSRILLESCWVGTPVIVHDFGLLGHLVRRHGLGLAVDCRDARALRRAIVELAGDSEAHRRYTDGLSRFAARYSSERFVRAVQAPFRDTGAAEPASVGERAMERVVEA